MTMGDRIAVMQSGLVQQVDAPLNLYNHPANIFVAGFIGSPSMNFFDARVSKNGSGYVFDAGSVKLAAPASRTDALKPYEGKTVVFGVRPEDLFDKRLSMVPAEAGNTFQSLVEVTEPMGDRIHLYLASPPHTLVANVDAECQAQDEQPIE